MRNFILLLIVILSHSTAIAETIDGPANIRSEPNGAVVASIVDGVKVIVRNYKDGWFEVHIPIYVDAKAVNSESLSVAAKFTINDSKGRIIGRTIGISKFLYGLDDETEGKVQGVIVGYTSKSNIRPESILETEIEKLLHNGKYLLETEWLNHMKVSGYQSWKTYGDIESFSVDEEYALDPSPTPRLILFFCKKKLFAIYHVKSINFSGFKGVREILDGKIHYIEELTGRASEDFNKEFINVLAVAD